MPVDDKKLFKWLALLIVAPLALAVFGGDNFRYPCQDPANWDKDICKKPQCDVTRTCPEHIFKGQRDPRQGMSAESQPQGQAPVTQPRQGAECK